MIARNATSGEASRRGHAQGACGHSHAGHAESGTPENHEHIHGPGCGCGYRAATPPDPSALVSVRGVYLRRSGRELLSGVDLDVKRGEIVTLIGPNGAGKSTLVKIVLGILRPDHGTVSKPSATVIGYVPQRFEADSAIPMSVGRFLALGCDVGREDIASALAEVGAAHTADQPLSGISGGETQRVLMARALLRKPNLLVLDEPASGVDYAGEAELYDLIGAMRDRHNLGILLVSHDLHIVMAKSDRVLCLNGHVCCSGKPDAVMRSAEYAQLFGPEAARTLAFYHHHHDHRHDLAGTTLPIAGDPREGG